MLSAFFDIQPASTSPKAFGKKPSAAAAKHRPPKKKQQPPQPAAEPEGTEPGTTHIHAGFVPLPPETNVPKASEPEGQAWQAYAESGAVKDDDVAEFKADWEEWDGDDEMAEEAEGSEPDFEPESLDPISASPGIEDSLGSSVEDVPFFLSRRKSYGAAAQGVPVYTGPQLCCEDEDFE